MSGLLANSGTPPRRLSCVSVKIAGIHVTEGQNARNSGRGGRLRLTSIDDRLLRKSHRCLRQWAVPWIRMG